MSQQSRFSGMINMNESEEAFVLLELKTIFRRST